jgi:uncharacterized protein
MTVEISTHETGSPEVVPLEEKIETLKSALVKLGDVVVGFSGGVDSAFLLKVAHDALGERCVALTAVSPSLPAAERVDAQKLAEKMGVRHVLRESDEIHNPAYKANPKNRCYFCKMALFDIAETLVAHEGVGHMVIGTNLTDLKGHLPGLDAAKERGVLCPLVDAGFTKADVREASRRMGLEVWDKPAFACLSSRFPYGTPITEAKLNKVETCEDVLRDLGFRVFRVRYHDDMVRIEFGESELFRAFEEGIRGPILERCKAVGFKYVAIDLQGYRRGSMNE